jgi:hypothetical protein
MHVGPVHQRPRCGRSIQSLGAKLAAEEILSILERIRGSSELQNLLFDLCDFELDDGDLDWIRLADGYSARAFGRDGAGDAFCLLASPHAQDQSVLYVTSEGQAGVIAPTIESFFAVIAAVPNWRDALKFSGSGQLSEMRRSQLLLEREMREDVEDFDQRRKELMSVLGLPRPDDPIALIHSSIAASPAPLVFAPVDGYPYEGLFNTFVWQGS